MDESGRSERPKVGGQISNYTVCEKKDGPEILKCTVISANTELERSNEIGRSAEFTKIKLIKKGCLNSGPSTITFAFAQKIDHYRPGPSTLVQLVRSVWLKTVGVARQLSLDRPL